MLDHAVGAPALEVVTRVAQETRENLVVVLAGHGREPADAAGRLRQLERCPGGGQGTEDGMVELHEHLARLHRGSATISATLLTGSAASPPAARVGHPSTFD